jgi:hypothetical protein
MHLVVVDSVSELDRSAEGAVVVCGSHGGRYPAAVAANRRVRAIFFNDASVGLEEAGIAGLDLLESLGVPALAVGHMTARIGDARDSLERGIVTHLNSRAEALSCAPGMTVPEAGRALRDAPPSTPAEGTVVEEARHLLREGPPRLWALDSVSLVGQEDAGAVVVTGSHGGLLGGRPEKALRTDARAAVFNDAGGGIDDAGLTRLPALDTRGIAAAVVAAASARIGDARSTYFDGMISHVNMTAQQLGARPGLTTAAFVGLFLRAEPDS